MTPIDNDPLAADVAVRDDAREADPKKGGDDSAAAARAASIAAATRIAAEIDRSVAAAATDVAADVAPASAAPEAAADASPVRAGPGGLKEALAARQRATKLRTGRQQLDAGQPNSALGWLLELIRDHPDTPEGQEATELVLELAARWEREGRMRLAIGLYERLEALA